MVADKSYFQFFMLFFLSAAICTHSISEARRCSDQLCKEPIAEAKVIADYVAASDNQLSLTKDDTVTVYSKESGSDPELWGGEVNGKTGYFPKAYVQETKVFNKNPSFIVVTEIQGRDETQKDIKSSADDSMSRVASDAAGSEQENPTARSETDSKSVTQLAESTNENLQEQDSKQKEGEMANSKPEESNGNGETAGMMSSIVNKVTDFFNAPDEDDEVEFPQLDTPKPDDAVSPGKPETAVKENVVDFSHLVDEGSLGMGLEDGADDSNKINDNEYEKGEKKVEPVKPPPFDFISKETKEGAKRTQSTENREGSDLQNSEVDEDGNFEDAITQGLSSGDIREFQKSREKDKGNTHKDLKNDQQLSETASGNILDKEFEQLNNLKNKFEKIQKLKEIEERMKPAEQQDFGPSVEELDLRRQILNLELRLKKKVNDPDFLIKSGYVKKDNSAVDSPTVQIMAAASSVELNKEDVRRKQNQEEDHESAVANKLKNTEEEKVKKLESQNIEEVKKRLEQDSFRKEEERRRLVEKERLKLEANKQEEDRIKNEEIRRLERDKQKKHEQERKIKEEYLKEKEEEEKLEQDRLRREDEMKRAEEMRFKHEIRKREEDRIKSEELRRMQEEKLKKKNEETRRNQELIRMKQLEKQLEEERKAERLQAQKSKIEEERIAKEKIKEEERKKRIDEAVAKRLKSVEDKYHQEQKEAEERRRKEIEKEEQEIERQFKEKLESMVSSHTRKGESRNLDLQTKEEKEHADAAQNGVHNRRQGEENKERKSFPPLSDYTLHLEPSVCNSVNPKNRRDCGVDTEDECHQEGCCWSSTGSVRCFFAPSFIDAEKAYNRAMYAKIQEEEDSISYTVTKSRNTKVSVKKDFPKQTSQTSLATMQEVQKSYTSTSSIKTPVPEISEDSSSTTSHFTYSISTTTGTRATTNPTSASASTVAGKSTVTDATSPTRCSTASIVATVTSGSSTTTESCASVVSTITSASSASEFTVTDKSTATSASSSTSTSSSSTVSEEEKVVAIYKSMPTATAVTLKNNSGNGDNIQHSISEQGLNSESLTKDVSVVVNATELKSHIEVQVRDEKAFVSRAKAKERNTANVLKNDASETVLSPDTSDHEKENHTKTGKFTEFLRSFKSFHDNSAERIIYLWQSTRNVMNGVLGFFGLGQVLNDFEKMHPIVVLGSIVVGSLGLFYVLGTCCGRRSKAAHGVSAHDQLRTFEARIKILEDERDETMAKKDEMEKKLKEAKKKHLTSDEAASSAHRNLEKLIKKVQRSEEEKARLSATIEQMQAEIKSLNSSCNQRDVQVEQLESVVENKESILRDKCEEITEIEEALKEKDQRRDALEEQIASIENQLRESVEKSLQVQEQFETMKKKYNEVQLSLDEYAMRNSQLQEQLDFRTTEVGVLQDCLMQIKEIDEEDEERDKKKAEQLNLLMNAAKAKAELRIVTEEKEKFEKNYYVNKHRREELEEQLKEFEQEMLKLKTAEEQAQVEAKELEIKYDTMRNYFKEAEVDLHRKLTSEEAARLASQNQLKLELGKASTAVQDLDKYRRQYGDLKEEIAKLRENFRSQLADVEERAHENWLKFRTSERELEEIKRERDGLRRRVFELEKEKTRPNSSQGQINHVEARDSGQTPPGGGRIPPGAPFPPPPPGHQSPVPMPPLIRMRGPPVPPASYAPVPVPPFSHTPSPQPARYGFPQLDGREVDARPPSRGSRYSMNTPQPSDTSYSHLDATTDTSRLTNSSSAPKNCRQVMNQPGRKISDNKRPPSVGECDGASPRPLLTGPTVPPPGVTSMFAPRGPFPPSARQPHLGPPSMAPPPVMAITPHGLSHGPPREPPPAGLNNFRNTVTVGRSAPPQKIEESDSFQKTPLRGK